MAYIDWRVHADAIFYGYRMSKLRLEKALREAALSSRFLSDAPVTGGGSGDPVLQSVLLLDNPRIQAMEKEVKAVEWVYSQISSKTNGENWLLFMNELYNKHRTMTDAADAVNVSLRTAKRWKKAAGLLLARKLGWE